MRIPTVLVTGGAGFIGSHLCPALARAGWSVRILDRFTEQIHGRHPGARIRALRRRHELIVADVCDRAAVARAVRGAKAIIHLAAETGTAQSMYEPARYTDTNVLGTARLLEAAARGGARPRFLLASSRAVYGEGWYRCRRCGPVTAPPRSALQLRRRRWEPVCPNGGHALTPLPTPETAPVSPASVYAETKLAAEGLVRTMANAYRLPAASLRFFNVFGPGQALRNPYTGVLTVFFNILRAGGTPEVYEDGMESRDFIYVDDVVRAVRSALRRPLVPGEVINIGTGREVTILEAARRVAHALGIPARPRITGAARVGDIRRCTAHTAVARRRLGFSARIPFDEGLRRFVLWALRNAGPSGSGGPSNGIARAEKELRAAGLMT